MKILKNIFAVVSFTFFIASCSPTEVTEGDIPEQIEEIANSGDDEKEVDDGRD